MSVRKVSAPVSAWLEDQVEGLNAEQILKTASTLRLKAALVRIHPSTIPESEMLSGRECVKLAGLLSQWAALLEARSAELVTASALDVVEGVMP